MSRRALLVRAGALGDILLLRRAVATLHAGGYEPWLLAPEAGSVLLGPGGSEARGRLPWDRADVARLMSAGGPPAGPLREELERFDLAVVYSADPLLRDNLGACIPRVLALDPRPPEGSTQHVSTRLCEPLARHGLTVAEPPPLRPTAEEQAAAAPLVGKLPPGFLAIHPGSGSAAKNWPAERFAALVQELSLREPWLLVEGPADGSAARTLARLPGAVAARHLSPRVLAAALAASGVFVGNDSGVSHLAAAAGAPTVTVFGPTDPAWWMPVGPRVTVVRDSSARMEAVPPEAVLAAARLLRRGRRGGGPPQGIVES